MGCTIVTQLSSARTGRCERDSQECAGTDCTMRDSGSLRSGQSCNGTVTLDNGHSQEESKGMDYLPDLTENHYARAISPSPLPPAR